MPHTLIPSTSSIWSPPAQDMSLPQNSPARPLKNRFLPPISTNSTGECREPGFPAGSLRVSLRKSFLKPYWAVVGGHHQPSICSPYASPTFALANRPQRTCPAARRPLPAQIFMPGGAGRNPHVGLPMKTAKFSPPIEGEIKRGCARHSIFILPGAGRLASTCLMASFSHPS